MAVMDIKRPRPKPAAQAPAPVATGPDWKRILATVTSRRTRLAFVIVLVAIGCISVGYIHEHQSATSAQQHAAEVQAVITKVGKLVLLPSGGQVPTVAIIKNVATLHNQPFFANAHNGDYVLIYTQAKKAILYRPSINRVVSYSGTD